MDSKDLIYSLGNDSSFVNMTKEEKALLRRALLEEIHRREKISTSRQIREIEPVDRWLESEYFLGPNFVYLYDYWKDTIRDIYRTDRKESINEVILGGCFTGDTMISLLDGRELSMVEIVEEFGDHTPFWVYSCDSKGNVVPGKAFGARKTGINRKLVEVVLDNGEKIRCTPDHKFLLGTLEYRAAEELEGTIIKSRNGFVEVVSVRELEEREDVYDFEVEEHHNFALSSGIFVHNSIGTGKSTTSIIIMLRKFYELSCYENIPVLLNLMPTSTIVFIYFSVNKNQAEITGFGDMRSMIDSIPYFKDHFPRKEKLDSVIVFPENIMMTYGSGTQHSIGMNVLGSILDEANFFRGESSGSQVVSSSASRISDLYSSIVNRSKSRFVSSDGYDSSLSVLVSSSTHESSFTEQRIRAGLKDPHTLIRTPKLWEVKPGSYSKKKFWVFQGNSALDPFIIESVEDVNRFRLSEGLSRFKKSEVGDSGTDLEEDKDEETVRKAIESLPDHHKELFLDVPVDLRKGFDTNIIRSLQDIGGVSVAPMGRLFSSKDVYQRACKPYLSHPFIQDAVVISTGDSVRLHDFLYPQYKFKDPSKKRFIHIDQSVTSDSTGIACGYVREMITDGEVIKPLISMDFMLRILPPKPPKRIAIYKIRDFVIYLSRVMNLPLAKISYDIFSSEDSRQILTEMGFNAVYASIDKNDKAYTDLVEIMFEDRLEFYDYLPFRTELFSLIHNRDRKKVDHGKENVDGSAGCFLGDTKIKLLNGNSVPIEELVGRENIELYGCTEKGVIVPVKAKKIFKTKEVTSYVLVTLDSGEVIRCTEDHRFMLRNGSYRQARYLASQDSLMTLYHYNHKVVSAEFVDCESTPVYDIEVPLTNNFALSAGVFVHNSKDVSDAVAGVVYGILSSSYSNASVHDGIEDFRMANPVSPSFYTGHSSYQTKGNVSDLIDREISRILDEF